MIKALHILDSTKRDEKIVRLYDSVQDLDNIYLFNKEIVKLKNSQDSLTFLKSCSNVLFYDSKIAPKFKDISFDILFVYGLNIRQIELCNLFKKQHTKIIWISLGGDIYSNAFINKSELYQPYTLSLLKKLSLLKNKNFSLFYKIFGKYSNSSKFFKTIDFVSPRLDTEMSIVEKVIKAPYLKIPLGDNLDRVNKSYDRIHSKAKDIYIGPSGSPTANHLDVFYKIKNLNLSCEVIVTLSYKVNKIYQSEILKIGKDLFGKKFKPQTDFYSVDEFQSVLNNCKIAIFNNERQEGLLTIAMCAEKGMKVFMSDTSPAFRYLKKVGYNIFSFQKDFNIDIIFNSDCSFPSNIDKNSVFHFDEKNAIQNALRKILN